MVAGKSLVSADKLCEKLRVKLKAEFYSPEGQKHPKGLTITTV
jgi:hypothetical protein